MLHLEISGIGQKVAGFNGMSFFHIYEDKVDASARVLIRN